MGVYRSYDPLVVALSVLIAVVAATAALWAAVSVRGFLASLGASVVMGIAVTGMHYTGMAAVDVQVSHGSHTGHGSSLILPMLVGPLVFLFVAAAIVMLDPLLIMGEDASHRGTVQRIDVDDLTVRRMDVDDLRSPLDTADNWGVGAAVGRDNDR